MATVNNSASSGVPDSVINNPQTSSVAEQTPQQILLQKFVSIINSSALRKREKQKQCSVCTEMMGKQRDLALLCCGHFFHIECISPWVSNHNTCPLCRKTFYEKPEPLSETSVPNMTPLFSFDFPIHDFPMPFSNIESAHMRSSGVSFPLTRNNNSDLGLGNVFSLLRSLGPPGSHASFY